jgi:homoserine dehydrogenase
MPRREAAVRRALKAMDTDGILLGAPQVIRIERN